MKKFLFLISFLLVSIVSSQSKVGGIVQDESGYPVAFANIVFKNSSEGTITNDNGRFYLESDDTYNTIIISFIGYDTQEIKLDRKVNYDLEVVMVESAEQLDEVIVYTGKQSKKNNPAIDILKKIWAKKRVNGVRKFKSYQYDKYEKVEFDLNTIDSALIKSKLFKGLSLYFKTWIPLVLQARPIYQCF